MIKESQTITSKPSKESKETESQGVIKPTKTILPSKLAGEKAEIGKYVAIDCEMIGVGPEGRESVLARVSLVNYHGAVIYDQFVKPKEKVTDYRTWVSGITAKDIEKAKNFKDVQKEVFDIINSRILVGHALSNDLKALFLTHPPYQIRDTSKFEHLHSIAKTNRPKLKNLAKLILGIEIQEGEHSSVIDAQATMEIYKRYQTLWEGKIAKNLKIMQAKKGNKKGSSKKNNNKKSASPQPPLKSQNDNQSPWWEF